MSNISILNLVHSILHYSGIVILFRWIFARNNITIVMYHKPEEETFRIHMRYLSKRYNFITLSDLINTVYSDRLFDIPKYSLLITFDDGWKENIKLMDVMREYKIRPVIYLTSHLINTNRNFWFTICNPAEIERLKKKSTNQRLKELKNVYDYYPEKEFPENRQALNLEEIKEMKSSVDFGVHTCFHTILTKCDLNEKNFEIAGSIARLEELFGIHVTSFAYPNGDYNDETIEILKINNIKIARTIDAGWNSRKSDPFRLKVTGVSDSATVNKLASELTGISMFTQYLLKGSFWGLKPRI